MRRTVLYAIFMTLSVLPGLAQRTIPFEVKSSDENWSVAGEMEGELKIGNKGRRVSGKVLGAVCPPLRVQEKMSQSRHFLGRTLLRVGMLQFH